MKTTSIRKQTKIWEEGSKRKIIIIFLCLSKQYHEKVNQLQRSENQLQISQNQLQRSQQENITLDREKQ